MMGFDTSKDKEFMERAVQLALDSEKAGNLPVGALIVLDDEIIAEGPNALLVPDFHPGRHAEIEALKQVPIQLWQRAPEMICYTTLEPCIMCFGTLLLHGVGRVVFGAKDKKGGTTELLNHLPEYYQTGNRVFKWDGPILPETCDKLYDRAAKRFDELFPAENK